MIKALIVGGLTGQVASALAGCGDNRFEFVAAGRPDTDLAKPATLEHAVFSTRPGVVFCCGAYTAVDLAETQAEAAHEANADGPGALARICAQAGIPMVHLSTDFVFDGTKPTPYVETDPTSPLSVYGRTKLAGEEQVKAAGGRHAILRISWVHAPRGKNFVRTMLRLAKTRPRLGVVSDQIGRPSYAPDVAKGMLDVAARMIREPGAPSGVFHMTGLGESCSWRDFAGEIFSGARARGGPATDVDAISTSQYPTPARRPANSALDCSKLQDTYGVALPPWRAGLDRCLDAIAIEGWNLD